MKHWYVKNIKAYINGSEEPTDVLLEEKVYDGGYIVDYDISASAKVIIEGQKVRLENGKIIVKGFHLAHTDLSKYTKALEDRLNSLDRLVYLPGRNLITLNPVIHGLDDYTYAELVDLLENEDKIRVAETLVKNMANAYMDYMAHVHSKPVYAKIEIKNASLFNNYHVDVKGELTVEKEGEETVKKPFESDVRLFDLTVDGFTHEFADVWIKNIIEPLFERTEG